MQNPQVMQSMQELLENIVEECRPFTAEGKLADYIPQLAGANPAQLGAYIMDVEGRGCGAGDWQRKITIQSIVKVAVFISVLSEMPLSQITRFLSLNATAESFNSLSDLEKQNAHKPLNPYINSGAMVGISLLSGSMERRWDKIMALLQRLTGNSALTVDEATFRSEKATGHRNRAIAYFMLSTNIIKDTDVEALTDMYFRLCPGEVDCRDLACFAATLINGGLNPLSKKEAASSEACRIARSVMVSCGMYNQSGEFLVNAALPAKSGVSGGIMATGRRRYGLGVAGPAINEYSNSAAGIRVLERLSQELDLSII
jgi:glutaminase